jgi:hypothetical protein
MGRKRAPMRLGRALPVICRRAGKRRNRVAPGQTMIQAILLPVPRGEGPKLGARLVAPLRDPSDHVFPRRNGQHTSASTAYQTPPGARIQEPASFRAAQ